MLDFIFTNYLHLVGAYALIYVTYVIYALYALRFKRRVAVDKDDFSEVCQEAFFSPIILPFRLIGNGLSLVRAGILYLVNVGLKPEVRK